MTLPSQAHIPLADHLAELLGSDQGLGAFRAAVQLHKLSMGATESEGQSTKSESNSESNSEQVVQVGIWQRKARDSAAPFVRIVTGDRWRLWADVTEIPPKGSKQRIVLIGESVARGFFYDPHVNPAMMLQRMLNAAAGEDVVEVVDLARIDLSLQALLKLAKAAVALEPDAILIFAGNNWHPISTLGADQIREVALTVRNCGSWTGVKAYLEQALREQVEQLLAALGTISKQHKIPITFLIPEFNLVDWLSDATTPPLLNDVKLHQWLSARREAEQALQDGNFAEARRLARFLTEIDAGSTPVGFNIESKCNIENAELRNLRENARDAGMALTRHQSPRCFGVIQEVLRTSASAHGLSVVDLPHRFEEYLGGLPDRRLFHDYCHLTVEGMKVAMASAAEHLLPILSHTQKGWRSLVAIEYSYPSKIGAEANFLAALHNANAGNDREMVRFHLDRAIQFDPEIVEMMSLYLDFYLLTTPSPLCSSFEQMARKASPSVLSLLLRSSRHEKTLDFGLVEELVRAIGGVRPEGAERARWLMIAEHKICSEGLNLLQQPYAGAPQELSWDQKRYGYYRSCTRESKFVFVCEKTDGAAFRITSRIHAKSAGQEIVVKINSVPVRAFEGRNTWQHIVFAVSESHLRHGINELEIVWPKDGWRCPERAARVIAALEEGRIPEAGLIYGELYVVMVSRLRVAESAQGDRPLLAEATA